MAIPFNSQFGCELFLEGYVEGVAEVMLRVLGQHSIEVSPAQRQQIIECTDLELLDTWIDQAIDGTEPTGLDDGEQPGDGDAAPNPVARQAS